MYLLLQKNQSHSKDIWTWAWQTLSALLPSALLLLLLPRSQKNDAKHIPNISVKLSVNNVLAKNWSTFRQMQTLDKITNFSLNHGIKMYLPFCSLHLVFKTGGWTFSLVASIQVSSLHLKFLNCFQLTEYFVTKGFKREKKPEEIKFYFSVWIKNKQTH